jgi:hypothetical protein
MNLYQAMHRRLGPGCANAGIILLRAILIVLVIVLSNSQFNSFTYMRM